MPWPQLSTVLPPACGILDESGKRIIQILALACIAFSIGALRGAAYGQTSAQVTNADTALGIRLLNPGDVKEAAKAFRAAAAPPDVRKGCALPARTDATRGYAPSRGE
jgi:hypothetical protein